MSKKGIFLFIRNWGKRLKENSSEINQIYPARIQLSSSGGEFRLCSEESHRTTRHKSDGGAGDETRALCHRKWE